MTKIFARWLEEKNYLLLLGTLVFTLAYAASPQAARAEGTQTGTFSAAANKTTTIYSNQSTVDQTVLVSICVTTAPSGNLAVAVEDRLSDGTSPVSPALASVKFGQCTSIAYLLPDTHIITVRSPSSAASAGTYTVSVQLNPPPPGP
jgi:hypothetical protein